MALSNTNGNYLKIVQVNPNTQMCIANMYKDESTRNAPSEFDKAVEVNVQLNTFQTVGASYTSTGNIMDDLKTVGYLALKNEPPFNGASGETWTDC